VDRRKVLLAWPLTHLPDLDYLVGYHRATLHNVWVLLAFAAVLLWSLRPARRDPALAEWMGIALVYVGSHLLMDVFAGGVTLLYPLSTYTLCWTWTIDVVTATNTPVVTFGPCSYDGIPVIAEVYPWLPWNEAAFLAFLIPATLAVLAWRLWRRRRGESAARDPPP
jgi:membrane-bound metal-dependent hydrolase YbcI (DUF457 family)